MSRLRREIGLFAIGGVLGFVVDAGIVTLLVQMFRIDPYLARVPSFLAAATVTWLWNRTFTFAGRRRHRAGVEWLRWLLVMMLGAGINYGTYAMVLALWAPARAWPVWGVAAGSALAAGFNFAAARALVFTGLKSTR